MVQGARPVPARRRGGTWSGPGCRGAARRACGCFLRLSVRRGSRLARPRAALRRRRRGGPRRFGGRGAGRCSWPRDKARRVPYPATHGRTENTSRPCELGSGDSRGAGGASSCAARRARSPRRSRGRAAPSDGSRPRPPHPGRSIPGRAGRAGGRPRRGGAGGVCLGGVARAPDRFRRRGP